MICSPAAARSAYVNEEIAPFKSRHPDRPVIPLIVGGKPGDPERECFPPALKFKLDANGRVTKKKAELLAADAREEGDGKDLALAKVIAGLLGLSSDDVFRRAERERRAAARRRRRVQALVAGLAVLLLAVGLGWWKQGYLKEQFHWHTVMGPAVLTAQQERALKPGDEFTECNVSCPTMMVIPAGKFMMGSTNGTGNDDEHPQHEVSIDALAVGKFEITLAERQLCMDAGACDPGDSGGSLELPAVELSWNEAKQFAAWLSRVTGKRYRLLSESEWEYAARAGSTTMYAFGDDEAILGSHAWYAKDRIRLVGQKAPNDFGLYDMHGNATEWVEDCYRESYDGAPQDGSVWSGRCSYRVVRGGCWSDPPVKLRSAARSVAPADYRHNTIGFRIARTLNQ